MAEPQIFQSELQYCMAPFRGEYSYELNSADKFYPELAMTRTHARGGTMIMWKSSLDRYVTVYQVSTPSFLPVIYSPPGYPTSVHIALYLPTAGREADFLEQLAQLSSCLSELTVLFISGVMAIQMRITGEESNY